MNFEYSPYILPLIAAALISATVAVYAWMRRSTNSAFALFLMSAAIFEWAVGYSLEIAGTNIETKYFWGVIQYFGIAFAPYGWLLFSMAYSDHAKIITRRFAFLAALIPSITVLLALTTKWHGLIWSEYHINHSGDFSALGVSYGAWFWAHFVYSYAILLIGTVLLVRVLWRRQGMHREQIVALLIAVLAPWIGNALYLTGHSPIPHLDLTPFAFTVTVAALAWATFGFHLVDITPLARDSVIDSMREGVIVLNTRGNVVDINNAAARMIDVPIANAIGKTADDVFHPWSHLVERFRNATEAKDVISVGEGESKRSYEVRLSPLHDSQSHLVGRVIMLRAMDNEALKQERDLLERLVEERTHELAAARDESEKISADLRKYYRAIEQSGGSVVITDIKGNIEYVNPGFERATGYSLAEAQGENPRLLKSGRQSDEYYRQMWQTISCGETWQGEFLNKRKDGSLYWEAATIAPVLNQQGAITNYVAIKQDITEQKTLQDQLQKQNDYLSILHATALDLLKSKDIAVLLNMIVSNAVELVGASYGYIFLSEGDDLVLRAATANDNFVSNIGYREKKPAAGILGRVWQTMKPFALEDYSAWNERNSFYESLNPHAFAGIPIIGRSGALGVLEVARLGDNLSPFTPQEISEFEQLAALASLALDNANLYAQAENELAERKRAQDSLQRSNQHEQVINSLLKIVLEDKSMDEALAAILDEILSIKWLTIAPKGGIFLFNEQTNRLDLRVHRNLAPALQTMCSQIALGQCLCGRAALTREIQFADCLDERHEIRYEGIQEHGHYNVPILQGEKILGVVVLYLPHGYQKTEKDINFLRAAADAIASILRRKQTENLLLESETRFRQIVENANDVIYRTDTQGNFTYVNPTSLIIMGYKNESEVIGRNYLELAAPEWRHKLKRFYDHQFLTKQSNSYFEFPAINANDETIWFGQSVQIIEEGGAVVGFQAVARDITNLVKARDALAISRDQALEANRAKGQLLSRVSHELRTPLGGILGFAELIQIKAFGALNEKQAHAVDNIIASANYLTSMVNDLLDEAQMESRSMLLDNAYFNPAELIEKVQSSMTVLAAKKGVAFHVDLSADLPNEIYGDIKRLQQIIVNLAGNAIKFTREGEVRVSFKRPTPTRWAIEVRDTGAGIPQSEYESIFEPFRQVNNAITRENRGSGLGLSITKQLVEIMGGQINLESEIGKGSLFVIALPIINAPGE